MSKVLLIVDMTDDEYKEFNNHKGKEAIVDIGYHYDAYEGFAYLRKRLLCAKPMPEKIPQALIDETEEKNMLPTACRYKGWNDCIDEILGRGV